MYVVPNWARTFVPKLKIAILCPKIFYQNIFAKRKSSWCPKKSVGAQKNRVSAQKKFLNKIVRAQLGTKRT